MSNFRERAGGYLRNAGGVNLEKIAVYGGLALALYMAWKTYRAGAAVAGALNATGSALGIGLYDLFHPSAGERATSTQYTVYFPGENTFHAVDSLDVSASGIFSRGGKRYQIGVLKVPQKHPGGKTISKVANPI